LIGRGSYRFSGRNCWGFSQLIGWIDLSCKRSLYFLLHNKNPQTEELVFPHWVFPGVILPKNICLSCDVIVVIFFIVDQIYFCCALFSFVKKPSCNLRKTISENYFNVLSKFLSDIL
jgi:hypothetical protein